MQDFIIKIGFSEEDAAYLSKVCDTLTEDKESRDKIKCALDDLFLCRERKYNEILKQLSEEKNIHIYTVNLAFLLLAARPLRYIYKAKGISEDVYYNSVLDLSTKNDECKKVYGIVGTFVSDWMSLYYWFRIYGLGRLQYEPMASDIDYKDYVKKGDTVLNCHIPSTGPLTEELLTDSLKKAYDFFGYTGPMPVRCASWLIHPGIATCYKEGSNMKMFYDCFEIVFKKDSGNCGYWRVFDKLNFDEVKEEELKTSFQKSFYKYLKDGKSVGFGVGYFMYEPEKGIYR
ncbi:MAG: DUF5596 domain-containing protein [Clostridia bacterium]|nr:DUF5596 domain-containing protein [Clostridia bacterium]